MTGTWSPGPGATAGDDLYVGDGDNETIDGLGGNDIMVGAGGDDTLISSVGSDDLIGGDGYDTADFSGRTLRGMIGEIGAVGFRDGGATNEGYELERIIGTQFADYLRITNGDLNGGAGNDLLVVSNGTATGGAGNDLFWAHNTHTISDFSVTDDWFMFNAGGNFTSVSYAGNDTLLTSSTGQIITLQNATLSLAEANARIAGYYLNTFLFQGTNVTANTGSATTDFVFGWDNALSFAALGGDDSLIGSNVNDVLNGGDGDDYMDGALGTDTASYAGASSGVTVSLSLQGSWQDTGGAGQDFLLRFESLLGSSFNDVLRGDTNANTLSGGDGNDTIYAGDDFVADTIDGGADYDIVDYSAVTDDSVAIGGSFTSGLQVFRSVYGSASGRDTIANAEEVIGSSASDYIVTQNGIVRGGDGNDLIGSVSGGQAYGDAGRDYFYLGSGDYTIMDFELGVDRLASIDTITSITIDGADTILTTNGGADVRVANINTLTLGEWQALLTMNGWGVDTGNTLSFWGTASDNFVWGGAFNDTLDGNAGDDTLVGGSGNDTLNGGDNDDRLEGGSGDDTLNGNNHNDTLDGGSGTNTLNGGAGDDYLIGGSGNDTFDGGDGIDTLSYERATSGVTVQINGNGATGAGTDSSSNIENLVGSALVDNLSGDDSANVIWGGAGYDTIYGWGGNDTLHAEAGGATLYGGDGDDTLNGSDTSDSLYGGAGLDHHYGNDGDDYIQVEVGQMESGEVYDGGDGFDSIGMWHNGGTIVFDFSVTTVSSIDRIEFQAGGGVSTTLAMNASQLGGGFSSSLAVQGAGIANIVRITSTAAASYTLADWTFTSWNTNDYVEHIGSSSADAITGSTSTDRIYGGDGGDMLNGGGGNDYLFGALGNDAIDGGAGADTAAFAVLSDDAAWQRNADGSWTVTSAEGTETLTSVEYLEFTDRSVFLDRAYSTFSGDGTSDILMRHANGSMGVWFVDGAGVTGAAGLAGLSADWTIEGLGDFNNDGRFDILMRHTNGNLGTWFMNGAATSGAAGLGAVDAAWDIVGLGDLNGDTVDDIVMWHDNGSLGVWFMNNGAVSSAAGLGAIDQGDWNFEALADFNGDGRDDILWRSNSGDAGIWFMDGASASGASIGNIAMNWTIEGAGDFDGDGRDDILMRDQAGNLGMWLMNGAAATGVALANVDASFAVAAIGDYNGDGRDDILWWNDNGALGVWFMNGATATATSYGGVSHDWVINPGG